LTRGAQRAGLNRACWAMLLASTMTIGACVAMRATAAPTEVVVDGWVIPTPYPLPSGAIQLALDAAPIPGHLDLPSDAKFACNEKAIEVQIAYRPDASPALTIDGGVGPIWPYGVSARLYNGRAEIVLPDGSVIGRDGDTLFLNGGLGPDGKRDMICLPGSGTYPVRASQAH
jgi:hypothetical protein